MFNDFEINLYANLELFLEAYLLQSERDTGNECLLYLSNRTLNGYSENDFSIENKTKPKKIGFPDRNVIFVGELALPCLGSSYPKVSDFERMRITFRNLFNIEWLLNNTKIFQNLKFEKVDNGYLVKLKLEKENE